MSKKFRSSSYKFSLQTSLYISLTSLVVFNLKTIFNTSCSGTCYIERFFDSILSVDFLLVWISIFIISFIILQKRVQTMFLNRIKQIYEDLDFKSDSLISTSSIVSNMDLLIEDLGEYVKIKKTEIESLKKQDEYRKEFIGNVAHELKTPLFSIQGYISNLLDGAASDKKLLEKYLNRADKSVDRLAYIIKDLDLISQIESSITKLDISSFEILDLIKEILEELEISASNHNIKLILDSRNAEGVQVDADRNRIQQVLINLILNSINYGKPKGTTEISFESKGQKLLIRVTDNGLGISEENMPRLFERFFRVNISRSRDHGGSGLGLAIVKHIIEAHNENINVVSTLGIGSEFSFTLKKSKIPFN